MLCPVRSHRRHVAGRHLAKGCLRVEAARLEDDDRPSAAAPPAVVETRPGHDCALLPPRSQDHLVAPGNRDRLVHEVQGLGDLGFLKGQEHGQKAPQRGAIVAGGCGALRTIDRPMPIALQVRRSEYRCFARTCQIRTSASRSLWMISSVEYLWMEPSASRQLHAREYQPGPEKPGQGSGENGLPRSGAAAATPSCQRTRPSSSKPDRVPIRFARGAVTVGRRVRSAGG